MPWYLGNIHCHSSRSDGDSPADVVARFYRDGGMQFLAITDHNLLTGPEHCGEAADGFVVLRGSEFTGKATTVGGAFRPLHVGGIGVTAAVAPVGESADPVAVLQQAVDAVRAASGIAVFNHPNWFWAYGADEMARVRGATAFELWNGGYPSNNLGDAEHSSTERIWDDLLSAGHRLLAFASDDCHRVASRHVTKEMPFSGWMGVWAENLTAEGIVAALRDGRCYASTGPRLRRLALTPDLVGVEVEPWDGCAFSTTVIGSGGRVLATGSGPETWYRPRGDEGYVRVRVDSAMGHRAWTQPMFADDPTTWWRAEPSA
ncbi:MAG TPA: CehA/McbA family metallohydrolase [Planctomycetota bacterium]|nr:CehA/McbA family metallohydrolase [Planctomycetota bacterium]